jgi:hypothetical protein
MVEMELYAAKIGLPVPEIQKFFDYYESNGWKVGRNPMRNWQAAMRNWKLNVQTYGNSKINNRNTYNPRNEGIIRGPTDYGKLAIEKQRRQDAARQAAVAGQVVADAAAPPTDSANGG